MTNTTLLIIAIMLVAILIMMIVNINLGNTNKTLTDKISHQKTKLMDISDELKDAKNDSKFYSTMFDASIKYRNYLVEEKEKIRSIIDSLPADIQSYIERMMKDD